MFIAFHFHCKNTHFRETDPTTPVKHASSSNITLSKIKFPMKSSFREPLPHYPTAPASRKTALTRSAAPPHCNLA
jgi:hypothetical protein